MKLSQLTLHDYRTYAGRQTLDLSTRGANRPIILIGGLNGAGKTTLLDALQLVLYGGRAKLASRGAMAYKTYLREAIHRNSDPNGGASIELEFTHASEGQERKYLVRRAWRPTGAGMTERVEVEVDGALDPVLTDHWDERVDDFVPHRISNLFFFDGEEIKELQAEETAADILRTSIYSLLGLDLVDRLVDDLAILDRKKRREAGAEVDQQASESARGERDRYAGELKKAAEERAALLTRMDREGVERERLQRTYREEGGELADGRLSLEAELKELQSRREAAREELRGLALGALPLVLVKGDLARLNQAAKDAQQAEQAGLVSRVLGDRDQWILEGLAEVLGGDELAKLTMRLAEDRKQRAPESGQGNDDFGLDPDQARDLELLAEGELPALESQAARLRSDLDGLSESILLVERRLQGIPEEGALHHLREARAKAEANYRASESELAAVDERIRRLNGQVEQATERLRKALERELAQFKEGDGERRKLERAQQAAEVLGAFRLRVLEDNIKRVENAVLESFQHLVRKPGLVHRLSIDKETFDVELRNEKGLVVKRDDLSAGEKQLLAISILWGLAKTAGIPMPVVVDTPLGRLDSQHRLKLIEHYFPQASHQVLLLSTDEEIRQQRLEDLEPFLSRSYLLAYDDQQDRTTVEEGYFQHQA